MSLNQDETIGNWVGDLYDVQFRELVVSTSPGWTANNPSICWTGEAYRFSVRSSNFVLDPSGMRHQSLDPDGVIITHNYVGYADSDLNVMGLSPVDYSRVCDSEYPWVKGIEDCRLFWDYINCAWKLSGTYRTSNGTPKIAVDTLLFNEVVHREVLEGDGWDKPDKNWMPTGRGNQFIHGPWMIDGIEHRGSSQALMINGYYYGVLHYCTWPGRNYVHRLAKFRVSDFGLIALGQPFHFIAPGVEFCNGIDYHEPSGRIVLSFGYRESRCFLALVPLNQVEASLRATG